MRNFDMNIDVNKDQLMLFDDMETKKFDAHEEWQGMPEYNNKKELEPIITVKFKFKSKEDFELFNKLLKESVYKTNKVFDGMQRKFEKQAWFPLKEKGGSYYYE